MTNDIAQTVAQLKAMRGLIATGWTQGTFARDGAGRDVNYSDPAACQFCIAGAEGRVLEDGNLGYVGYSWDYLREALDQIDSHRERAFGLVGYNDEPGRTKEDMLTLIDTAIGLAEADTVRIP
jgi:hypothetical protein